MDVLNVSMIKLRRNLMTSSFAKSNTDFSMMEDKIDGLNEVKKWCMVVWINQIHLLKLQ